MLCDAMALEPPTDPTIDRRNDEDGLWRRMDRSWLRGVRSWYNDGDFTTAMDLFRESLDHVSFRDDDLPNPRTDDGDGGGGRVGGRDAGVVYPAQRPCMGLEHWAQSTQGRERALDADRPQKQT